MIEVGNTQQVEFSATGERPLQRSSATSTKTLSACASRRAKYLASIKSALPAIHAARQEGAKNAREFAAYLNSNAIPAPSNKEWSESAVLRCLRRLRALKLDVGSNLASNARRPSCVYRPRRFKPLPPKGIAKATETASSNAVRKLHGTALTSGLTPSEVGQAAPGQVDAMFELFKPSSVTTSGGERKSR